MTDDVLELDAPPPAPSWSGRRVWTRRRTVVVTALLLAALTLLVGALLRPPPPPEPDVLGLREGPVEAWRLAARPEGLSPALVGDHSLLIADHPGAGETEAAVRLVDAWTGEERWRRTAPSSAGADPLKVADLPGTPWVAVVTAEEVLLWDRESGEPGGAIPVPVDRWPSTTVVAGEPHTVEGVTWVSSDDAGLVFVGNSQLRTLAVDDGGWVQMSWGSAELTAYDATDPAKPLWTATLADHDGVSPGGFWPARRHLGYAFFTAADWLLPAWHRHPAYGAVFNITDGARPEWADPDAQLHLVGDVGVLRSPTGVRAVDIVSGEQLWQAPQSAVEILVSDAELYLWHSDGTVERRDPRSGTLRWQRELPWALSSPPGQVLWTMWGSDPIVWAGDQETTEVVRLDARSGREVMRFTVDSPVDGVAVRVGEQQLVVTSSSVVENSDSVMTMDTRTVTGLAPDTGEVRWRKDFDYEGGVGFFGRHLVYWADTGDMIFYR